MKNTTKWFIEAQVEFKKSKCSEQSVEGLYDLVYFLKDKKRSFNESYILAQTYHLLGQNIYASKVIDESLLNADKNQSKKLNKLLKIIDNQDVFTIKRYRDLRVSKIIKKSVKISRDDFIIREVEKERPTELRIKDAIKNIVIANKRLKNGDDIAIFIFNKDLENCMEQLIDFIEWLGQLKMELINFYNNSNFEYKLNKVGQEWFDGLDVSDLTIKVSENKKITTNIIFYDYAQNDFGFFLKIEDRKIMSIEYDPIL